MHIPERLIEAAIREELTLRGYICLHTSTHLRRGGSYATGADKGVPDLLVTHKRWPTGAWLGIEVKTATGRLSAEQKNLYELGRIYVVRSAEEAWLIVRTFDNYIRKDNY